MASNSANVKMGVTGVAQFKQSMNQAKQAVKTLDAQLSLTEKEFKATGDQEAYMAKKTEELKAKLEAQKSVVENAEKALEEMAKKGVDRNSKAYQDLYREILKTKGEMIDTENAMNGIADAGGAAADSVEAMNEQLQTIGDGISIQNVTSALDSITDGMEAVIKKSWELGKAIIRSTLSGGEWADELATTATQFEISPEELYRMRETARWIDTDADTILAAKDKLKKGMEGQDKDVMGLIAAAGFDPSGMSTDDVFWKLGDYISNLATEEDKVKQSTKAFGRSWRELLPLFNAGREEYEETMNSVSWVGDKQFESLTKLDDASQSIQSEWQALKLQFEGTMAEAMLPVMNTLTDLMKEFNEYLESEKGQQMLESLGDAVESLFTDLTKVDPEKTMQDIIGIFDGLQKGLEWISTHKGAVKTAIEGFIGAWAVLKTAKGVTTALQLINGIRGLANGGAAAGAAAGASWGGAFASAVLKAAPWLLGLYEILKPSQGGNDDVVDAEGNLTEFAKETGFEIGNNGEIIAPKKNYSYAIENLPGLGSEWNTTGDEVDKTSLRLRNTKGSLPDLDDATSKMEKAASDLTGGSDAQKQSSSEMLQAAGTLEGMPALVYDAILAGMSQIKIFIDGQQAGGILSPFVNSAFASAVGAFKP